MKLQSLISFVITIFNTLMIIMKLLFGIIIDRFYYEDIVNQFINFSNKDIKSQLINPKIGKRIKQTQNDKINLENQKERKIEEFHKQDFIIISGNKILDEKNLR